MLKTLHIEGLPKMSNQEHVLEVYEPYDYQGHNPIQAAGVSVLPGPMRDEYYLVQVKHPFQVGAAEVELLLIQPRYNGDKIDRAVSSTCTVNISRVTHALNPDPAERLSFEDFESWGVGKISLSSI
jgi:hypothetical protein